jgi:hypothetical protein
MGYGWNDRFTWSERTNGTRLTLAVVRFRRSEKQSLRPLAYGAFGRPRDDAHIRIRQTQTIPQYQLKRQTA